MRLSWNEIRARAARFAEEWQDAHYEKGEAQSFYNDFFQVFGVKRRKVATFEEPVKLLGENRGFIDLFWKGVLLVEQKSVGRSLRKAKQQALDYFPGLRDADLPRYILVSDFQTFELHDLEEDKSKSFKLHELPAQVEEFTFVLGVQKREFRDQDPVNIEASELMGRLHDALKASGYEGHALERLLVRLVFCLFADDTGIFEPRDIFLDLILQRTMEDGADTGRMLNELFDVLNTNETLRQTTLDDDLKTFPYVNGDLFLERLPTAAFDAAMRELLIEACEFKWDAISPAIFGSLFQSVMKPQERRASGAHYTTEKNIMKVIQPLFLDDLRAEFERLKARRDTGRTNALKAFQDRLGRLRLFDPACGCGNFLIIAYRELRQLELQLLQEIHAKSEGSIQMFDVATMSKVDVNQFYGIEIGEFPARIAETALWMMDHIMNSRLSLAFGEAFVRIPLRSSPHVHNADALETDWKTVLNPRECSYVFGNPPFVGAKMQTDKQRQQVRDIAQLGGSGGTLDYVCAWFLKAGAYLGVSRARIGFVATNSVTQGEQVAQVWPLLFDRYGLEISFAHRTFAWGSDARGMAHVHVVIVGLTKRQDEPATKRLFSYDDLKGDPIESRHASLSPYLIDAGALADRHLVIEERSSPIDDAPRLVSGTQPIDDGNYILNADQRRELLTSEANARHLVRPYIGSVEYINGVKRWIIYPKAATPTELRALPGIRARMRAVKAFRLKSKRKSTLAIANYPERYNVEMIPSSPFLCIPEVSSERRDYVPIGWLGPPTIPSNLVRVLENADLWHFGILTSRMHMAWLRNIGGRLESRYRYSVGIVYNSFPWPQAASGRVDAVRALARAVLNARRAHPNATLADLYDPETMPTDLRRAHAALDTAIDRLYRTAPFQGDRERVEHLFGLYETLVAPLVAPTRRARFRPRPSRRGLKERPPARA